MRLEVMDSFFNTRAATYDDHMLADLKLNAFYEAVAGCFAGLEDGMRLLDLGCGTGLELARLFVLYPHMRVTGVDLSPGMLEQLRAKYPEKALELVQGSYLEAPWRPDTYDCALSTYSLHHFAEKEKVELYHKILMGLKPGGLFVEGDYTVQTPLEQQRYQEELARMRGAGELRPGTLYHYDIPFTAEAQVKFLEQAGFVNVTIVKRWERTTLIAARRGGKSCR